MLQRCVARVKNRLCELSRVTLGKNTLFLKQSFKNGKWPPVKMYHLLEAVNLNKYLNSSEFRRVGVVLLW